MSTAIVNMPISSEIYQRLERVALRLQKPIEAVLNETLLAVLPIDDGIPAEIRREVDGLTVLSTTELRRVATSEMTDADQAALEELLDLQNMRLLTPTEKAKIESLRREYGRVLLRKARAFALLTERGHSLLN